MGRHDVDQIASRSELELQLIHLGIRDRQRAQANYAALRQLDIHAGRISAGVHDQRVVSEGSCGNVQWARKWRHGSQDQRHLDRVVAGARKHRCGARVGSDRDLVGTTARVDLSAAHMGRNHVHRVNARPTRKSEAFDASIGHSGAGRKQCVVRTRTDRGRCEGELCWTRPTRVVQHQQICARASGDRQRGQNVPHCSSRRNAVVIKDKCVVVRARRNGNAAGGQRTANQNLAAHTRVRIAEVTHQFDRSERGQSRLRSHVHVVARQHRDVAASTPNAGTCTYHDVLAS